MVARTAKSKKSKGTLYENEIVHDWESVGWIAMRQPGSGQYQGHPHDVKLRTPSGSFEFIVEAKRRDGQNDNERKHNLAGAVWRTGERWLGKACMLACRANHGFSHYFIPWEILKGLASYIVQLEARNSELETELKKKDAA